MPVGSATIDNGIPAVLIPLVAQLRDAASPLDVAIILDAAPPPLRSRGVFAAARRNVLKGEHLAAAIASIGLDRFVRDVGREEAAPILHRLPTKQM